MMLVCSCASGRVRFEKAVAENRAIARASFLKRGECHHHEVVRCADGARLVIASDGFISHVTSWDAQLNQLSESHSSCVAQRADGTPPPCAEATRVVEHDLCAEELATLDVASIEVSVFCTGHPLVTTKDATLVLLMAGTTLRFELSGTPRRVNVKLEPVPPGVTVAECDGDQHCTELAEGQSLSAQRLRVHSHGSTTACEFDLRPSFSSPVISATSKP